MPLDKTLLDALQAVTTALTTVLLKKGIRRCWMRGPMPRFAAGQDRRPGLHPPSRAGREDLATPESWSSPTSTRAAIEAMPEGCIAWSTRWVGAGCRLFGDILCAPD